MAEDRSQESISWGELAELTHATQVERFGWCGCEDSDEKTFPDCPKATYHGITQATCLKCGKVTRNISTLEMMNDLDARCADCDTHLVAWFTNGQIVITGETEKGEEIRLEVKP